MVFQSSCDSSRTPRELPIKKVHFPRRYRPIPCPLQEIADHPNPAGSRSASPPGSLVCRLRRDHPVSVRLITTSDRSTLPGPARAELDRTARYRSGRLSESESSRVRSRDNWTWLVRSELQYRGQSLMEKSDGQGPDSLLSRDPSQSSGSSRLTNADVAKPPFPRIVGRACHYQSVAPAIETRRHFAVWRRRLRPARPSVPKI